MCRNHEDHGTRKKPNNSLLTYQIKRIFFITIAQKIVSKHFRNLHQLLEVDTFASKQLIYIGLLAIDLFGKPSDRTTLPFKFSLNHFAHMDVFHDKIHTKNRLFVPQK